jgi:Bacterial membrane protein YfhO
MLDPTLPRMSAIKNVPTTTASSRQPLWRRGDVIACLGLIITAILFVSPALFKGFSFGPYDHLSNYPLTQGLTGIPHNNLNEDQIQQMSPWYYLDWINIHSGSLPLWNRYTLLGMPHFFNFQSASLSLPVLISYLVPSSLSYLVVVIVTLIIGGSGTYYFSRCLSLSPFYAFFAAITFQLGGSFANWIGWPLSTTASYLGWILGSSYMLLVTWNHRRRNTTILAVAVAFALYSGHPETVALLSICCAFFIATILVARYYRKEISYREILVFGGWESAGVISGLLLALPLILPGLQIITSTHRTGLQGYQPLPLFALMGLTTQGIWGYPITGLPSFGPLNYYEISSYVGPLVLILAIYGCYRERLKPEVQALTIGALAMIILVFNFRIPAYIINHLPFLSNIPFTRGLMPLDFFLAVLSGFGLQHIISQFETKQRTSLLIWLSAGMALFFVGALALAWYKSKPFVFTQGILGGLAMVVILGIGIWLANRYPKIGQPAVRYGIPSVQLIFLLVAGAGINSYSPKFFPENDSMRTVQNIVKDDLLGTINNYGPNTFGGNGYIPEINSAYGVREFAGYDPVLPTFYFSSYEQLTGNSTTRIPWLAPNINNADLARTYGIRYVIAPASDNVLQIPDFTLVSQGKGYQLYEVSGARTFTLDGVSDTDSAIHSVRWINNYTCEIHLTSPSETQFIARIGNFPGWHATVNGKSVSLESWQTAMMRMPVPEGDSVVTLTYWPERLTLGLWIACITLALFIGWWLFAFIQSRRNNAP